MSQYEQVEKHNESFKKLGNSGFGGDKSGNRCQSQTVGILNDRLSNSDFYKMSASSHWRFPVGVIEYTWEFGKINLAVNA